MTGPHWTVDGNDLVCEDETGYSVIVLANLKDDVWPEHWTALMAAVRDANTLAQARERVALWDGEKTTALAIFKELKELLAVDR